MLPCCATVLVVHNTLRIVLIVRRAPKTSTYIKLLVSYEPLGIEVIAKASLLRVRRGRSCLDSLASAASAALRLTYSKRATAAA